MALAQYQTLANQNLDYPPAPEGAITNESLGYYPQGQAGYLDPQREQAAQSRDLSREAQKLASGKVPEFQGGGIDDPRQRWLGAVLQLPREVAAGILSTHRVNPQEIQQAMLMRQTVGSFQTLSEDTALKRAAAKADVARKMSDVYPNPKAAARAEGVSLPGLSAGFGDQVNGVPGVRAQAQSNIPPMPPEIASSSRRVQQQWLLQQTRPSIAGAGAFTPQTLEFTAKQYLAGDRQAAQGFARNATARIALQNAIVEEATKQGLGPREVAAKMADFAGIMAGSRAVGQRAANISLAATEAQEMLDIVKEQSSQFPRGSFVPWNMALRAYESGTGSPEIAAFGASVNALVNVYARAINPTGVPTVSDKEHARAVLNTVQSQEQVDAVLGIIRRELEIAKRAPATVRKATSSSITGPEKSSTTNGGASVSNW